MKRIWICLICLALLLAGCGKKNAEVEVPPAVMPVHQETPEVEVVSGSFLLSTQQAVYSTQTKQLYFYLENQSEKEIMTGRDHSLQVLEGEKWTDVPFREDYAWTAEGLLVPPGKTIALTCNLEMFDYDFSHGGSFRITKTVEGVLCTAEFRISEEAEEEIRIRLEELPADYGAGSAEETAVVFTGDGVKNGKAVLDFLDQYALGVPGSLRTVQDYGEGAVMVIDVTYENDHFLWRMWDGGAVTEKRYSYLVTDGTDVYLSNGADWDSTRTYNSEKTRLIPLSDRTAAAQVETLTEARLAGNITRYRVWSPGEGPYLWSAGLTDTAGEFSVERRGNGVQGRLYTLEELGKEEREIRNLDWEEDGLLLLTCKSRDSSTEFLRFDPEKEEIL